MGFWKEALTVSAYNLLARILPVVSLPLLQRFVYGPDEFGLYGFFFTVASIAGTVCSLNYDVASSVMVKEKQFSHLSYAFSVVTIYSGGIIVLTILAMIAAMWLFPWNGVEITLPTAMAIVAGIFGGYLLAVNDLFSTTLASLNRPVETGKATLIASSVNEAIRWSGLLLPSGWMLVAARLISIGSAIIYMLRIITLQAQIFLVVRWKILKQFIGRYLSFQAFLWTSSIMATFNMQLPVLFFALTGDMRMVGLFTAAAAYAVGLSYFISRGIQQVVYSRFVSEKITMRRISFKHVFATGGLYLGGFIALLLFPEAIVDVILGAKWKGFINVILWVYAYAFPAGIYWILYPGITFYGLKRVQFAGEILRTIGGICLVFLVHILSYPSIFLPAFAFIQIAYFMAMISSIVWNGLRMEKKLNHSSPMDKFRN